MTSIASPTQVLNKQADPTSIDGRTDGFYVLDGQKMYRIDSFDRMRPFLMSIVSESDLWMFLSSTGGLTAGRVNEDRAIFPYVTDDLLHKCHRVTGPITLLRVHDDRANESVLWEPFAPELSSKSVRRNLYKNAMGNRVIFEEVNQQLGLRFQYQWCNSDEFGFVRSCILENQSDREIQVDVLDGVLNVLPAGPELGTQQREIGRASCRERVCVPV